MYTILLLLFVNTICIANTTINDTNIELMQKIVYENDPNQVAETTSIAAHTKHISQAHSEQQQLFYTIVPKKDNSNFFFIRSIQNHPQCIIKIHGDIANIQVDTSPSCKQEL